MNALLYISLSIYVLYMVWILTKFGIPKSVSDSYYLLKREYGKPVCLSFTGFCWLTSFTLLPYWLSVSPTNITFMAALACFGLIFVGGAAAFKEVLTNETHFISASICIIFALLWIILTSGFIIPLTVFSICCCIAIFNRNWTFWIETAAFITLYIALLWK